MVVRRGIVEAVGPRCFERSGAKHENDDRLNEYGAAHDGKISLHRVTGCLSTLRKLHGDG
jgi:hypothetical protein